jgi:hypothetical protein
VEKISTAALLFAANDLADSGMVEADQLADFSERETVLLGLRESFASGLSGGLAVSLKLLLGGLNRLTCCLVL